jgi:hypothetical protein
LISLTLHMNSHLWWVHAHYSPQLVERWTYVSSPLLSHTPHRSKIDSLVDAVATLKLMSLLDCYWGYHQIWMKKEDEPKTSFITPSGTYCYPRMPEGLKNAGGSFSRMTSKVFHSQIGRNVLTYVDDMSHPDLRDKARCISYMHQRRQHI